MGKSKEAGAARTGMIAAERYARFFLEHPLVAVVYIFGSVALRGDGHDVDMVLEVKDEKLGLDFLQHLYDHVAEIMNAAAIHNRVPSGEYGNLRFYRIQHAYSLLGIEERMNSPEHRDIEWGGRWEEWNELCIAGRWDEALQVEEKSLRRVDLFLMPPRWRESEKVRELLPNWASGRPWARRSFYDIMVLQSREFNPQTSHFNSRRGGSKEEEAHLRHVLRQEKKTN